MCEGEGDVRKSENLFQGNNKQTKNWLKNNINKFMIPPTAIYATWG